MLLEVVTRCYKRPVMLAANQASLAAQHCSDWMQTLLIDEVGIGVAAANAQLAEFTPRGDYVWVLDDDDECADPHFVGALMGLAHLWEPAAILVRMDHGPGLGVLPNDYCYQHRAAIREGGIGCSALVVRRDVWMNLRSLWATGRYASDYDFARAVLDNYANDILSHDVIGSRTQNGRSVGRPE